MKGSFEIASVHLGELIHQCPPSIGGVAEFAPAEFLGEFTAEALTGPFDDEPFTVIFRTESKLKPITLLGTSVELSNGTYSLVKGGGHGRQVVGVFNAAEIVGIVRGSRHMLTPSA